MLMGGCQRQPQAAIEVPKWPYDLPFHLGKPGYETPSEIVLLRGMDRKTYPLRLRLSEDVS